MKYFYFNDLFEENKTTKDFIDFINENQDELTIFLNSGGGNSNIKQVLLDILNENKERIMLKASYFIGSNAFRLFFEFEGKKKIMDATYGMFHLTIMEVATLENNETVESDKMTKENMLNFYFETIKFCERIGMTEEEIQKIKEGKDVYFNNKRLREFK